VATGQLFGRASQRVKLAALLHLRSMNVHGQREINHRAPRAIRALPGDLAICAKTTFNADSAGAVREPPLQQCPSFMRRGDRRDWDEPRLQ
jgi:hypothetical protein